MPEKPEQGDTWVKFRQLLDAEYEWPGPYLFKFIVPRSGLEDVETLFTGTELQIRASKKGNYVSITAHYHAESADSVIDIYRSASQITGVISL